jgi:signal transduction histidine kinase/DNA-binding response OmpR family regulator
MPLVKYYSTFKRLVLSIALSTLIFSITCAQKPYDEPQLKKITQFNNIDSARRYSDSLLTVARRQNNRVFEARVFYLTSFKYYQVGEEVKALEYARGAVANSSPESDSSTYAKSRMMIAYMLSRSGKNGAALKEAFDVLKLTDTYGWRKLRIECRICIADLYRPLRDRNSALPIALQAVNEAQAIKDTSLYIAAASMLSNVYSNPVKHGTIPPKDVEMAVFYLEQILTKPYLQKINAFKKVNYMGNLGRLYEMQGRYNEAEDVLNSSLEIALKNNYPSLAKHNLNELMTLSIDHKNYSQAVAYGQRALAIQSGPNSNTTLQRNIYNKLSVAYEGLKDYKQAFNFAVRENRLNDSILTAEQTRSAAELDKKYQNDKKLLQAANRNNLLQQQRNFTIIIAIFILIAIIAVYRWFVYKKKKEAAALAVEHKQLARMDAMKSKFFANISHELKTPLTLIIGPTQQLLGNSAATGSEKENLQTIARNSKKLLDMVNELLDLGKIESGTLAVKPQAVQLASFIRLIYQGFASAADYKDITYTLTCKIDGHLHVSLDRDKFERVANNFISNAIKFTPATRSVNIVAGITGDMICFSVQDNGPGIHPQDISQIFDRYFQGNQNRMNAEGGTGIGLSIAKEFTELMGGRVEVENTYGEGVTFKAYIPLIPVTVQNSPIALQDDEGQLQPAATITGGKFILLVEDHDEMVKYIASILSPFYRVQTANNGVKALEVLQSADVLPDLIISDVMMPEMDGFALLGKLKEHPAYCHIPVIMLTALADSRNKLHALNIGVDDYLTKPFVSDELLARSANLLNNAAGRFYEDDDKETGAQIIVETAVKKKAVQPSPADLAWLNDLEKTVRTYIGKININLLIVSDEMAISERQLFRRIKGITGLTPNKYIRAIRLQVAREAIESGKYRTIAEISYMAGFETPAYFSKLFKEHYGRDVNELL